jgi:outer membrane protein
MRARPFHLLRRSVLPSAVLLVLIGALAAEPVRAQQQQQKQRTRSTAAPDSGASITYEEAVRLALERNYQLRRAQNDVTSQSISIDRNRAEFYPNLSLSVGGGRDFGRNFSQTQGEIVSRTSSEANVGAQSQVNLFNGFRDDATLDEAQARMQAASGTVQRTRREVAYRVLQRYIALAQHRALVDVRRQQLELRRQQLEQTQAQIEVGEKAPSAVYQIQADVAAARQDLVQARRDADLSQTELVRLLVLDPFGSYTFQTGSLDDRLDAAAATPASYQLDRLLTRAYQQREDLHARQAGVAADEQGVRAAQSGFWPRLDLSLSYGSNWNSLSRRAVEGTGQDPDVVEITPDGGSAPITLPVPGTGSAPQTTQTPFFDQLDARRGGGLSLSLSYPLFDRFQTRYQVEQAQVQLENARFQKELLRQDIAVEARQALVAYRNARTSLEVAAERLQAARRAQEAAQERYRLGAATYVELADANTSLAQAQSSRVRARYDLLLQKKRLSYVTGTLDPEAPLTAR